MERYSTSNSSTGTGSNDSTVTSSSGADMWPIQRRRFGSPSPDAFLGPAFDEVQRSHGPLDLDPVLLRYTRPPRFSSSTESSSSSRSLDSGSASLSRAQLRHLLQLRSASPLSPAGNFHGYKTPVEVEVEEGVLVMDGVLVSSELAAGPTSRVRLPWDPLESSGSSKSPVGGAGGAGSLYKTGICRAWEDTGVCRYGYKCQFAHGKAELRHGPVKLIKLEVVPESSQTGDGAHHCDHCFSYHSYQVGGQSGNRHAATAGSATCGVRHCAPSAAAALSSQGAKFLAAAPAPAMTTTVKAMEVVEAAATDSASPLPELKREPSSFVWPPSEADEELIQKALYGPSVRGRRLPVFEEICPTDITTNKSIGDAR